MLVNINQTINNLLNEDRTIKTSSTVEVYILKPDDGKVLRNIKTGQLIYGSIALRPTQKVKDFEEIDMPKEEDR